MEGPTACGNVRIDQNRLIFAVAFVLGSGKQPHGANKEQCSVKSPHGSAGIVQVLSTGSHDNSDPSILLRKMNLTPFTSLTWAYQLHYYLCFRTRRRRTLFSSERQVNLLSQLIQEISANHDYRLLEHKSYPTELRCLLSLISRIIWSFQLSTEKEYSAQPSVKH